ncbi:hypothetical protein Tco_0000616 [Tanacetum coccineum]
MKKPISGISPETSKKKRKVKRKMQKKSVQGKITKFFNKKDLHKTKVLKANNTTKFKKRSSKRLGYKISACKFKDMMFLKSIRRKKKSSRHDSLDCFKNRRLKNYPKTRKLIDEFNLEEEFGENVKVCGYRRNEDVNQNVRNREYIDVIEIDVEVQKVENDNLSLAQMKDIIDIGFGSLIGMATEEIPAKIAHFVVDKFDADLMTLKLTNAVIPITPELVYKVLGVPLGGEDINRMVRLGREDVTTLEWQRPFSRNGGQCMPGKSIIGYINEETRIHNLDWCKYVCMCLKMSKITWIKDGENSYYFGPLTALTLMYLFSTKCDSISVPRQTPAIKYWSTELIKKREIFEICNGGFGFLDLYSDDSCDDDILERELESKMDKLDQKVTLLKLIVEDLDETDYSLNFNDMSSNYNDGECSHGVEELDKNFINETVEEIVEDSLEEEMTEDVNQKVIEADIVLQKSINHDNQIKEQNIIDEDFQKSSEVVCIVEKSREDESNGFKLLTNIQNEEQMFVKGTNEEKEDEILNQDVSVGNVLKVIEADSISEKSREDESNGFKFKKETSFDFKIFETPKVDDKEKSVVREKQSLDRIQTVSFRPESDIDVLKEDIKPDIRDASIRLQPKREASVAWYLKSPFKVRGSALHTNVNNLTQTEVLTADRLFIMDEESDPVIFLESLAPGLKIEQPVIDAWADLLNFNERYKSPGSPSRYFFKPILTNHLKIEDFTTDEDRFNKFEECIRLCDYDSKRMLNSDKMFHLISVFDKYISKNSPGRCASIFRNVEPERFKMKWRTCENELDSGVFLMSHMDNYFGEAESKWDYGFLKESKEQNKQLKFLRSKYAARILMSENNPYKDEFQKEVDKVRLIDKNKRRELIEVAVMRRPAKVDEYFGYS